MRLGLITSYTTITGVRSFLMSIAITLTDKIN
jgi:hypothetical protein